MTTDRPRRNTKPKRSYNESQSDSESEDDDDFVLGSDDDNVENDKEDVEMESVVEDDSISKMSGSKRKELGKGSSGIEQYKASMEKVAESIASETATLQSKSRGGLASIELQLEELQIDEKENIKICGYCFFASTRYQPTIIGS